MVLDGGIYYLLKETLLTFCSINEHIHFMKINQEIPLYFIKKKTSLLAIDRLYFGSENILS